MAKFSVKNNNVTSAIKSFSHYNSELRKQGKKHEYHLRPSLKKKEKRKEAIKLRSKINKSKKSSSLHI